jgi:type IV secretion system protein VirB6
LALGPLFVAFLLFGATRGIAEGWIRGLLGATLGSTAIAVVLGVELALLEPWLGNLVSQRASGVAIPGVPVTVLAASMIFAIATAGLLALVTRLSLGLRLSSDRWQMPGLSSATAAAAPDRGASAATSTATASTGTRSRAAAIADSVAASDRRAETITSVGLSRAQTVGGSVVRTERESSPVAGTPLGQSFSRRTARRVSSGAIKRDRTS